MVALKGMAHFSIAVSDLERSTRFYCDIVGCKHVMTTPDKKLAFIDAGGDCLILVRNLPPINRVLDDHNGVHHSFMVDAQGLQARARQSARARRRGLLRRGPPGRRRQRAARLFPRSRRHRARIYRPHQLWRRQTGALIIWARRRRGGRAARLASDRRRSRPVPPAMTAIAASGAPRRSSCAADGAWGRARSRRSG